MGWRYEDDGLVWTWEVTNLSGVSQGIVVPRTATITRVLNGACSTTLVLDSDQASQAVHGRLLKGWRRPTAGGARVLRSHSQVTEVNVEAGTDSLETITLTTQDGYGVLGHRYLAEGTAFTQEYPRDIISGILDAEDARRVVGLYVDPAGIEAGPKRDREYEASKSAQEIIQQLAEVDDGFYFKIDPYEDGQLFSEITLLYPESGAQVGAPFEWGGVGNLQAVSATILPPANYISAYGAGDVDAQITSVQQDATSISALGLWEDTISFSDVSEQATLDQHALDALYPEPKKVYSVTPMRFGENLPTPWEDFDVGNLIEIRLRGESPYLKADALCRITSFSVEIDPDGVEFLTELILEEV